MQTLCFTLVAILLTLMLLDFVATKVSEIIVRKKLSKGINQFVQVLIEEKNKEEQGEEEDERN